MPHCDTLDGPVVLACKKALESGNINYALIWLPNESEEELKKAFEKTLKVRSQSDEARDLADYWFFETAVRLHRAGEGEGFDGLKPGGEADPVVQQAEQAIEEGSAEKFLDMMEDAVEDTLKERFQKVLDSKDYPVDDLEAGRRYIESYIGFVVYSHHLFEGLSHGSHLDEAGKHEH